MPFPWAAVPAAVLELILFATMTIWPKHVPERWLPWILAASGVLPYLLLPSDRSATATLLALSLLPALWFRALPRGRWWDFLFVAAMLAVFLSPLFEQAYGGKIEILGKAMWFRVGIVAVIFIAREPGIDFGFWPRAEDWRIGAKEFLLFLPVGIAIGFALGYFKAPEPQLLKGIGMFFGSLWFITVGEEFFFRGLLQRWTGIAPAAVLYGLSHLAFRQFPNWKHVAITIVLGIFCGRAFQQTKSVRAAMVTHALVNATWVGILGKA